MKKRNPLRKIQIKLYDEDQQTLSKIDQHKSKSAIMIQSALTTLTLKRIFIPFKRLSLISLKKHNQQIKQQLHHLKTERSTSSVQNKKYQKVSKNRSLSFLKQYASSRVKESQPLTKRISRIDSNTSENRKSKNVQKSIQRMENLRKNICQEKSKENKIKVEIDQQKMKVQSIGKGQMVMILDELKSLRAQVKQVKKINENFKNNKEEPKTERSSHIETQTSLLKYQFSNFSVSSPGYTNPQFFSRLGIQNKKELKRNTMVNKTRGTQNSQKSSTRSITPKITFNFVNPPIKLNVPKTESLKFISNDYNSSRVGVRKVENNVKAKKIILNQGCHPKHYQTQFRIY